jgi:hypothetical protein
VTATSFRFAGAAAVGNRVFFAPHNEANVGVLDTSTDSFSVIATVGVTATGATTSHLPHDPCCHAESHTRTQVRGFQEALQSATPCTSDPRSRPKSACSTQADTQYTQTDGHTHADVHTHRHIYTNIHKHTHTHTNTLTHTHIHTHTHTHTHTHKHTQQQWRRR